MNFNHPSLNTYQNECIRQAILLNPKMKRLYKTICSNPFYNPDQVKEALIDKIIVPFNAQRLNIQMQERIENGWFTVMGVGPGDTEGEPGFAHTVGLAVTRGYELFVSGLNQNLHHALLNLIADELKDQPDLTTLTLPYEINGQPMRNRLKRVPLSNLVEDKAFAVKRFTKVTNDMEGIVFLVGDKNNLLPGEPGYDTSFVQYFQE